MDDILDEAYRLTAAHAAGEMGVSEDELPRARPYRLEDVVADADAYRWTS